MRNNMHNKKSVFKRILLFSLIPIFILFIISIAILIYQSSEIKDKNIKSYTEQLNHNAEIIEKSIEEIVKSVDFLCFNDDVFSVLTTRKNEESISTNYVLKNIFTEYKNSNDLIESVGIYFKNGDYVVTNNGRTSIDNYLKNKSPQGEYDMKKIMEENIPVSGYRILGPIKTSQESGEHIIPILIGVAKNVKLVNLLIINVKCEGLLNYLSNGINIDETVFVLSERKTGTNFFSNKIAGMNAKDIKSIVSSVNAGKRFDVVFGNKKYVVISAAAKKYITNYFSLAVMVPNNMLLYDFYVSMIIIFLFMTIFMLIDIWICYRFSKILYEPIGKMTNYIGSIGYSQNEFSKNEFDIISECIKSLIDRNKNMNDKISSNLSILKENHLYKFLMSAHIIDEDEIKKRMLKNGISFRYDHYIVAVVRLKPTEKFYDSFMKNEYFIIINGIDSILKDMFAEDNNYDNFIIHHDDEHFIVIVNVNEDIRDNISKKLETFTQNFYQDREFMQTFVGIGNYYAGFNGMKKSYIEAKRAMSSILSIKSSAVMLYNDSKMNNTNYIYTIDNENIIYNYLLKGNYTEVENALCDIIKKNLQNGLGDNGFKLLYRQFYNTAVKVLGAKGISINELMREEQISHIDESDSDNESFIDYVCVVLKKTAEYTPNTNTSVDIDGIKNYIDMHFDEELYLDKIADLFGVNSKYLSRLIKEQIGINFNQYVMGVRIQKATEMLKNTSMSINEIMEKTGFNSRNTFVRVFKKFEGLTPSEYKKLNYKERGNNKNE